VHVILPSYLMAKETTVAGGDPMGRTYKIKNCVVFKSVVLLESLRIKHDLGNKETLILDKLYK
jgi:hypothetical protein